MATTRINGKLVVGNNNNDNNGIDVATEIGRLQADAEAADERVTAITDDLQTLTDDVLPLVNSDVLDLKASVSAIESFDVKLALSKKATVESLNTLATDVEACNTKVEQKMDSSAQTKINEDIKNVATTVSALSSLLQPSSFSKVPSLAPGEDENGQLLVSFENVGHGVPKLKYELILRIGGKIQEHTAVFKDSAELAATCNSETCTYTLVVLEAHDAAKLTAEVKASNPIAADGVLSGKSKEFDCAEMKWHEDAVGCDCLDVRSKPSGIYSFHCPDIKVDGKELRYSTYCMNDYTEASGTRRYPTGISSN